MANWAKYIQNALLGSLFALLLAPLAVSAARLVAPRNPILMRLRLPQLAGVMPEQTKPILNLRTWFGGTYQPKLATFLGQNFPGREPLVRLNNELEYRLFNQSSGNNNFIIIGKESQLYTYDYVAEYCHLRGAVAPERLQEIAEDIARLRARLQKRNIPLVVVLTPSKASTYPEYLPDIFQARHRASRSQPRSYEFFVPLLKKHGIPFVDSPALLQKEKAASTVPLFAQGGSHWTALGSFLATRALIETLNHERSTPPLAALTLKSTPMIPPPPGEDTDLAKLLNGITAPINYEVPYLDLQRSTGPSATKKLIVVGGSFCGKLIGPLYNHRIYSGVDHYFYYRRALRQFPAGTSRDVDTKAINWPKDIFDGDAIVLEINEEGFGETGKDTHYDTFITDALAHIDDAGNIR